MGISIEHSTIEQIGIGRTLFVGDFIYWNSHILHFFGATES